MDKIIKILAFKADSAKASMWFMHRKNEKGSEKVASLVSIEKTFFGVIYHHFDEKGYSLA